MNASSKKPHSWIQLKGLDPRTDLTTSAAVHSHSNTQRANLAVSIPLSLHLDHHRSVFSSQHTLPPTLQLPPAGSALASFVRKKQHGCGAATPTVLLQWAKWKHAYPARADDLCALPLWRVGASQLLNSRRKTSHRCVRLIGSHYKWFNPYHTFTSSITVWNNKW